MSCFAPSSNEMDVAKCLLQDTVCIGTEGFTQDLQWQILPYFCPHEKVSYNGSDQKLQKQILHIDLNFDHLLVPISFLLFPCNFLF